MKLNALACFLVLAPFAVGQTLLLTSPSGQPIAGAHVLDATSRRVLGSTDAGGHWEAERSCTVPLGVSVTAIGYVAASAELACDRLNELVLEEDAILLSGASVIGSLGPSTVQKLSPIRTQVLSGTALRALPADDAMEALDFTNGIRETVACGVCGSQEIHINGMEGAYTLVLLDGVPLLGGLASAYALDGLPLTMVQQVEVIQGPASARFGSQAVGGVINVVLEPVQHAQQQFRFRQDLHGRLVASATWGSANRRWQWGVDSQRFVRRIDDNGDGMTDAPTTERLVLTARHAFGGDRPSTVLVRGLAEQRFGGEVRFEEEHRGTDVRYGERVDVVRGEGIWSQAPSSHRPLRFIGGIAAHRQMSTYGLTEFNATEWMANLEALWNGVPLGSGQHLRGGMAVMWDVYWDETPVDSDMNVLLPALFLEEEGVAGPWSWIVGVRAESPLNGPDGSAPIVAPRLNVKWSPDPRWDVRLNTGRGYRRVHLFTEEHAALDGSRRVEVAGPLRPELSWNASASAHAAWGGDRGVVEGGVHAFATEFRDRLLADYTTDPDVVLYRNVAGRGRTRGVGADATCSTPRGLNVTLGATWLRAEIVEAGQVREVEFAPRWTGSAGIEQAHGRWTFSVQGQTTGPMRLPPVPGHPDISPPFALVHTQVGRTLGAHTVSIGLKNATDTRQPAPLIAPDAPFSPAFDASRIYGPIEGRRGFIEWRMHL